VATSHSRTLKPVDRNQHDVDTGDHASGDRGATSGATTPAVRFGPTVRYLRVAVVVTLWGAAVGFELPDPGTTGIVLGYGLLITLGAILGLPFVWWFAASGERPDAYRFGVLLVLLVVGFSACLRLLALQHPVLGDAARGFLLQVFLLWLLSALAAYQGARAVVSWVVFAGPVVGFALAAGDSVAVLFGTDPGIGPVVFDAALYGLLATLVGTGARRRLVDASPEAGS